MRLIGRDDIEAKIEDVVLPHEYGLRSHSGPIACYLLAGTSGSGKTRTVEYFANKWHGSPKMFVKIECGEFQLEHEVSKLIGAPPGYLGHRETTPQITQQKLTAVTGNNRNISLVLFDEIEKAAPSMHRLLLGIMDRGTLKLGDNSVCNFEKSIIFFTSNLGTGSLFRKNAFELLPSMKTEVENNVIKRAIDDFFPIEFRNRLTDIFYYHPLSVAECREVVICELADIVADWKRNIGNFSVEWADELIDKILELGFSRQFGGRELKRTIYREIVIPFAKFIHSNFRSVRLLPGHEVRFGWQNGLTIDLSKDETITTAAKSANRGKKIF